MPAVNSGGASVVPANPSAGLFVIMSPFSGPKNSPFDARKITGWVNGTPTYANDPTNFSTGALSTGIGFGADHVIGPVAPQSIKDAGFNDNYVPGLTKPDGNPDNFSTLVAIGGGRSGATVAGESPKDPYTSGFELLGFGEGGARDAGAGPIFTGFFEKMVTATGTVANGAAVEAGFVNRSGASVTIGQSVFGSSAAASAAVA